ncbi:MAG: HAD family hydrolase [Polyangiaceae bacterium]
MIALKAVVFDMDGTLYRQSPLRRAMLVRLLRAHVADPARGLQTARVLIAYRQAQEHLRASASHVGHDVKREVAEAQIQLACERTKVERHVVVEAVSRWMEHEPLGHLARCVQPGLLTFLHACKSRGLRLGVLSDYPAEAKLEALGLGGLFDVVLCAQAPEIGAFKPHPRGLLLSLDRLGVAATDSLYVGDRAEVDGATAEAAGVRCAILMRRRASSQPRSWMHAYGYSHLHELLWGS